MPNFKITIEYDGTDFAGWQIQGKKERTVQGEIEKALKIIFKKSIRLYGAGRTDAGVHARAQVANFKAETLLAQTVITRALNNNLPNDISILNTELVPDHFHAQFDAKQKTYRYTVLNRQTPPALERRFCLHVPYKLNLTMMRKEALGIIGRKDFKSFMSSGSSVKTTKRKIKELRIIKKGDWIYFEITADGFLYKMVRNIVGTLLDLGSEHKIKDNMKDILRQKSRKAAGFSVPAQGLCLLKIEYN